MPCSPRAWQHMAALACPSHTPCKELLSQCPHPQGSQLSRHLGAVPGSPGCFSGFPPEKWRQALGRAQASRPQRVGSQELHQHRVGNRGSVHWLHASPQSGGHFQRPLRMLILPFHCAPHRPSQHCPLCGHNQLSSAPPTQLRAAPGPLTQFSAGQRVGRGEGCLRQLMTPEPRGF